MIVLWDLDGTLLLDNSPEGGLGVFAQALREVSGHEPVSIPDRHGKVDWQILDEIRQGAGLPVSFAGPLTRRFKELSEEWYSKPANACTPVPGVAEALQAVIRFVVGYYRKNPEFITLLNTENLHKGKHISKSMRAREYSSPAIEVIRRVLDSGQAQGLFRKDVSARDVYLLIAATGYFYMSNRHTLSAFLGEDLETPDALAHWESFVIDSVLRTVAPGPSLPKGKAAA